MTSNQKSPQSRLRRNLITVVVLAFGLMFAVSGYLSYLYGHFQKDFNKLNMAMQNGDYDTMEQQMDAMVQYHNIAVNWHLESYVDSHLLKNMYIYKAANILLKGDYQALNRDKTLASNAGSEHLLADILGLAKARYYQSLYQEKLSHIKAKNNEEPTKEEQEILDSILKKVIAEAQPYFKMAVENSPGNDLYFDYPFNYDLFQNEDSARRVMEGPGPGKPEELEYGDQPGDKPGGGKKGDKDGADGKKPEKLNPGNQKPGGEGQPRKPKG